MSRGSIVVGIALDEPFEAVLEAEDLEALLDRLDGDRADDAVDARRRAAANQQGQPSGPLFCDHFVSLPEREGREDLPHPFQFSGLNKN